MLPVEVQFWQKERMENDWLQCASFHQDLLTRNHDERRFDINLSKQPNLPYMEGKFERWLQVLFFFFVPFLSFWKRSRWLDSKCPRAWSSQSIGRLPLGGDRPHWTPYLTKWPLSDSLWLTFDSFCLVHEAVWGEAGIPNQTLWKPPGFWRAEVVFLHGCCAVVQLLGGFGMLRPRTSLNSLTLLSAASSAGYSTAAAGINLWPTAKIVMDNHEMTGKEAGWFHWHHFLNTSSRFAHKNEGKPEAAEKKKKKVCIHTYIYIIYIYNVCMYVLADASRWESPCTEWLTWIKWLHKVDLFVSISAAVRLWQPRSKAALREINLPMPSGIPERAGWSRPPIKPDSDWFPIRGTTR